MTLKVMVPEFSGKMLALFLEGRVVHEMALSGDIRKLARARVFKALAKCCRLQLKVIVSAAGGVLRDAQSRAGVWGGLGIVPADDGVLLLDDGGQYFASRAQSAPAVLDAKCQSPNRVTPLPCQGMEVQP